MNKTNADKIAELQGCVSISTAVLPGTVDLKHALLEGLGRRVVLRVYCDEGKKRTHAHFTDLNTFKSCGHAMTYIIFNCSWLQVSCMSECKPTYDALRLQLGVNSLKQISCICMPKSTAICTLHSLSDCIVDWLHGSYCEVGLQLGSPARLLDSRRRQ